MITTDQVRKMLIYVSENIVESEPMLTEIDSKIGDGDHGTGMRKGFSKVKEVLEANRYQTMNTLFKEVGLTLLKTMGGASGVLFGTLFIGGIKCVDDTDTLETGYLADFMKGSLASIQHRGKANVGDKTMVDALTPAVESLMDSKKANESLKTAMEKAADSAREGVEATKNMHARFGRSRKFGDLVIGLQDAGATSVYIIFDSMYKWLTQSTGERV